MMRYQFRIVHVPGKEHEAADALSRAPVDKSLSNEEVQFEEDVNFYASWVLQNIISPHLDMVKRKQDEDEVCTTIKRYIKSEWPARRSLHGDIKPFLAVKDELVEEDGVLLRGCRIVVPRSMQADILKRIHEGHQGIVKCRERAKSSVWWPGLSSKIEDLVQNCETCIKKAPERTEPLRPTPTPDRPWQLIGTDLFEWKNTSYLIVVDYFSRFIEAAEMPRRPTSAALVTRMKAIFARHGIPDVVKSDNGTQYMSREFREFSSSYGFRHVTSSPLHPQSNGEAERAVQTVKKLWMGNGDPYLALLSYRASPIASGISPAELLMGRKLKTTLPIAGKCLIPNWKEAETFRKQDMARKARSKIDFDSRHRASTLRPLKLGECVRIPDRKERGTVKAMTEDGRSYWIQVRSGCLRRNRRALRPLQLRH